MKVWKYLNMYSIDAFHGVVRSLFGVSIDLRKKARLENE